MGAVDAKQVRALGLRRTTTVTLGVAAASVAGALAFAGLAHAATEDARSKAAGGSSSDSTDGQGLSGPNAGDDRQIPSPPLFGGGGSRNNRGGAHASSGGS